MTIIREKKKKGRREEKEEGRIELGLAGSCYGRGLIPDLCLTKGSGIQVILVEVRAQGSSKSKPPGVSSIFEGSTAV